MRNKQKINEEKWVCPNCRIEFFNNPKWIECGCGWKMSKGKWIEPKQNKPDKEWEKEAAYFVNTLFELVLKRASLYEITLAVKKYTETILKSQKHDFDILVDTILDKHKNDLEEQRERIIKEINKRDWIYIDDVIKIIKEI